jgi:putative tricarboxylic transport membrane protein
VGLLVCYGGRRLGLGSITDPGSGFVFFWSGLILVILSTVLLVDSLRHGAIAPPEVERTNWAKISLVLGLLFAYALAVEDLGFVLTTFLFLVFLFRTSGVKNWTRAGAVAGAVALGSFAIFELWLKIRFPRGLLF